MKLELCPEDVVLIRVALCHMESIMRRAAVGDMTFEEKQFLLQRAKRYDVVYREVLAQSHK